MGARHTRPHCNARAKHGPALRGLGRPDGASACADGRTALCASTHVGRCQALGVNFGETHHAAGRDAAAPSSDCQSRRLRSSSDRAKRGATARACQAHSRPK
ncbi:DUF3459 domain-containing protein [Rhodoferax aquaticus]|uniref:DUF3459 domain-containing protein n=1 Tax=Rhodoferax aquaticus TaxID=2527691 RepID=A0A515EL42_9BURK|nr:DUF3459 domain-containing protein [Rhodoferax aquaticus]